MADDGPAGLRTWAGHTFHSFLLVLVIALFVLIPDTGRCIGLAAAHPGRLGRRPVIIDARRVRSDPHPSGMAGRY